MIVQTMTPEEVYREIDRDMPNVAAWWGRQREVLIKRARNMMRFPLTLWYEHTSRRHNRYLVMSIIMNRKYNTGSITAVLALQKMERGHALYFTRLPWQQVASKIAIMPHVLDRYAERCNINLSGIDLIKQFVYNNAHGETTSDSRLSGRSVRYKGRDNLCMSVHDGVLLGETVQDIFVARTIITYDMASGAQKDVFESNKDKILSKQEVFDAILSMHKEYEKERITDMLQDKTLMKLIKATK